jgi:hypothetical protein
MKASTPNVALKVAIVESGKKQRVVARLSRIPETKLSHIVRGRLEATDRERTALAKVLSRTVDQLFPHADTSLEAKAS